MSLHPETRAGEESRLESCLWLEVRGYLDSPVQDVSDISIHVDPEEPLRVGSAGPVVAGAIIGDGSPACSHS